MKPHGLGDDGFSGLSGTAPRTSGSFSGCILDNYHFARSCRRNEQRIIDQPRCQPRAESPGDLVKQFGLNTEAGSRLARGNSWFSSFGDVLGT
jgi:hypothetical protein